MEIIAYITDSKDRVLSGDCLVLLLPEGPERSACVAQLELALRADVVRLPNGDQMLLSKNK